jgi:hypothetical protein
MAKIQMKLPDDFAERLAKLSDKTDTILPKVLEAGGEVVLNAVRGNLQSVLSGDSTGELERSLGLSPAKQNRDGTGWDIKVGFWLKMAARAAASRRSPELSRCIMRRGRLARMVYCSRSTARGDCGRLMFMRAAFRYRFSPYFTRVIIASPDVAYAEFMGSRIPSGCKEITEAEFAAVVAEFDSGQDDTGETESESGDGGESTATE